MKSTPKPANVEQYLAQQPAHIRPILKQLRQTIRKAAPEAEEVISYGMPAFKQNGMVAYFMAHTNHYGFYPGSRPLEVFKGKLTSYKTSKGTVQFLYNKPVPVKLVTAMVKYNVKINLEKVALKELAKNSKKKK